MKTKERMKAICVMADVNRRQERLITKTIEELEELKDVIKDRHIEDFEDKRELRARLAEEAADVSIMIDQLMAELKLGGEFSAMQDYKIYRTVYEMAQEAKDQLEAGEDAADED